MPRNKGAPPSSTQELCSWRPRWQMLSHKHVNVKQGNGWQSRTRCNPLFVGLELDAQPVVEHAQRAIAIVYNGFRHDRLHFLRNHADIGTIAAVVAEAIVAKAVRQVAEKNDIVLEHDIGPTAAAATPTTATESSATATEATATTDAQAAAAGTGKACAPARGVPLSHSAGSDVAEGVASATRRPLCGWSTP